MFLKISKNLQKTPVLECVFLIKLKISLQTQVFFSMNFARLVRTPILYSICEQLLLVLVRIGLAYRAANLSVFSIIDFKSVFKVCDDIFNWFYTDQHPISAITLTMQCDSNRGMSWYPDTCKKKHRDLISLNNLF